MSNSTKVLHFLVFFYWVFLPAGANSASRTPPGLVSNFVAEIESPWTTQARPWLLGGTAATIFFIATQDTISYPDTRTIAANRPLGSFSKFGDYYGQMVPNGAYVLGMLSDYWISKNQNSLDRAELMTKATLYSAAWTTAIKTLAKEPRPDHSDEASFPSGHATTAFAFATFVTFEHGFLPWGLPALLMAGVTGYSRMNDDKHYLHDVVAGATIGAAYGIGMASLYPKDKISAEGTWQWMPILADDLTGVLATKSF